jgi:hypothetical protein
MTIFPLDHRRLSADLGVLDGSGRETPPSSDPVASFTTFSRAACRRASRLMSILQPNKE